MTRLLLVRHGETDWNAEGRLQGLADIPLSETGRRQATRLAFIIRTYRPDQAVCSDLSRTRETCLLLGYPAPRLDPLWREADLGAWTGQSVAKLKEDAGKDYIGWRSGTLTPPAGETWTALCRRVQAALDSVVEASGSQLIVTHGGPIRAACAVLLGLQPGSLVPVHPASVTIIDVDGHPTLRVFNLTGTADDSDVSE